MRSQRRSSTSAPPPTGTASGPTRPAAALAQPFTEVLDWSNPPFAKWFADGELNVAYNCLDRHVEAGNGDRVAILWEGEPGDSRASPTPS